MLRSLTLRCGTRDDPQPVKIDIAGILCVVGPNNSGKSFLLKQLEHALRVTGEYKPEFCAAAARHRRRYPRCRPQRGRRRSRSRSMPTSTATPAGARGYALGVISWSQDDPNDEGAMTRRSSVLAPTSGGSVL